VTYSSWITRLESSTALSVVLDPGSHDVLLSCLDYSHKVRYTTAVNKQYQFKVEQYAIIRDVDLRENALSIRYDQAGVISSKLTVRK
jgi:hypothetical protein